MKLFVGLGNPGKEYEQTRHNVGFFVIDELAKRWNVSLKTAKFRGLFGTASVSGEKVALCKPLTYMNLSGEAVRPLLDECEAGTEQLLVIYDDLDLPPGKLRLRQKGSAGGHNGIRSLIEHLGSDRFNRVRVGIGRPDDGADVIDYVLGGFHPEEQVVIDQAIAKAGCACIKWITTPFSVVMNEFNRAKS